MSTSRTNAVAYWVFTVLAAVLFAVPGTGLLLRVPHFTADMAHLGYPSYFLTILGAWKVLGALAILSPGLPRLKEWAYAGMCFDLSGAVASHALMGDGVSKVIGPCLVGSIVIASWMLRRESCWQPSVV